jgi:hypothetical protein
VQERRNEIGTAQYERDSMKRERRRDERGSGAMRDVAMQQERRQFNNQPARERCWSNERQGNAITSQHKRGAVRHERRWCDKRGVGGTARGGTARGGTMTARGGTTTARGGMVRGSMTTAQGGTAWGGATKGGMTENHLNSELSLT